jgi:hypothetical protein
MGLAHSLIRKCRLSREKLAHEDEGWAAEYPEPTCHSANKSVWSGIRANIFSMKKLLIVLLVLGALYVALCAGLMIAMRQPPETFARVMAHVPWRALMLFPFQSFWYRARAGRLHPGDRAPDFSLETTDHQTRFQLSSLAGQKPVVLVFGSYT